MTIGAAAGSSPPCLEAFGAVHGQGMEEALLSILYGGLNIITDACRSTMSIVSVG